MADNPKKEGWRQFQRIKFDRKKLTARTKKAQKATMRHAHRFIVRRWENVRYVRRNIIQWVIVIGCLIAAAALQTIWYQQHYTKETAAIGGVYAEASQGGISTMNPLFASTNSERSVSRLVFSNLLRYDTTGILQPDLAESFSVNPDETEYTVRLKTGVRWHDGTELTAKDVVFTVDLIKNPTVRSTITGWQGIVVEVVDDYTVKFTLPSRYAAFRHALTGLPILPEHLLGSIAPSSIREHTFGQNPVGTGPFSFRMQQIIDNEKSEKVVYLTRNTRYHHGSPKLERFQLHTFADAEAINRALRVGAVNAASTSSADVSLDLPRQRFTVDPHPVSGGVYALFNTKMGILQDTKIRKALQLGTDVDAVRKSVSEDIKPLSLPFIDGQLTGSGIPKAPGFNREAAEKILNDAGWKLGEDGIRSRDGQRLSLTLTTLRNPEFEKVVESLSGQWRKMGFEIENKILDSADTTQSIIQTVLQPRNFEVLLYQMEIGADPDVYAYWHSSQDSRLNYSNYSNEISDDALSSARQRYDPELRNSKYKIFAAEWLKDAPAIGIYQAVNYYVTTSGTESYESDSKMITPYDRFSDVRYWSTEKTRVYTTP